jgi:hypothetical protein
MEGTAVKKWHKRKNTAADLNIRFIRILPVLLIVISLGTASNQQVFKS